MLILDAAQTVSAAADPTVTITPVSGLIVVLTVAVAALASTKKLTVVETLVVGTLFLLIGSTEFGQTVRDALNGLAG